MPDQDRDRPAAPTGAPSSTPSAAHAPGSASVTRFPLPAEPALDAALRALRRGAGSEADEELVFKRLYRPLLRLFRRQRCSDADCEDLIQITVVRVFEHIEEYRSEGAFWAWVKRIAMNTLSNHFRDREALKRQASLEVPLPDDEPRDGERASAATRRELVEPPRAEKRALAEERRIQLGTALAELPERMRAVLILRLTGLTYEEIAAELDVGLNTVRSQLHEAKKQLRRILAASRPGLDDGEGR